MLRTGKSPAVRAPVLVSLLAILMLALASAPTALAGESADTLEPAQVFEELKSLEGTWEGGWAGEGEGSEKEGETEGTNARHVFRVASAGTVVMETMNQGTDHEMINMYHLVDDDLVITHYCAGGNQPLLKLDVERSDPRRLVFDFAGGTNVDPAVDPHIHAMELEIEGDDHIVSRWTGYNQGEAASSMSFDLARN